MAIKLIKVAKEFNVGLHTIVETLHAKGFPNVEQKPTTDITDEMLVVLQKEFQKDLAIKQEADKLLRPVLKKDAVGGSDTPPSPTPAPAATPRPSLLPPREPAAPKVEPPAEPKKEEQELVKRERPALRILGRIDLDAPKQAPVEKPAPVEEPKPEATKQEAPKQEAPKQEAP
ncbi:MAG: hypothetical protein JNN28_05515, partial [Saprospiraceae bacterium]|nr:hypothetical protein [Saprospiraceae bacterium]